MVARLLVVVSGLPASGKTTVGRQFGDRLPLPLIDQVRQAVAGLASQQAV